MSYGEFVQIRTPGSTTLWKRLPLGETGGKNEAWLRDLLQTHPELIPIADIDPSFGPLIPVCTELRTSVGPIDNVFVDRHGRLTIVECKLWRNPESRRKVVAQILDYAKELSGWAYADLQRQVSARVGQPGNFLFSLVQARHPEISEHWFSDSAAKALRTGRFLLLIAGDGIREDVRSIGDLINRNAASGFSFGMIEIALYSESGGDVLVQPRTILRTERIERTVVLLENGTISAVEGNGDTAEPGIGESTSEAARKIHADAEAWWTPVLEYKLDDPDQPEFRYYWPHNIRGPLPWPGTWLLAYRTGGAKPAVGVALRGREIPRSDLLGNLEPEAEAILEALPEGTVFERDKLGIERSWSDFQDDDQRRKWLLQTINAFVNELRPRISKLREHLNS